MIWQILITMLTCKPWQVEGGNQLLLQATGAHTDILNWATCHISQVQKACKYRWQDNWQPQSGESAHGGYIIVCSQCPLLEGKVPNSNHLFACYRSWCGCPLSAPTSHTKISLFFFVNTAGIVGKSTNMSKNHSFVCFAQTKDTIICGVDYTALRVDQEALWPNRRRGDAIITKTMSIRTSCKVMVRWNKMVNKW